MMTSVPHLTGNHYPLHRRITNQGTTSVVLFYCTFYKISVDRSGPLCHNLNQDMAPDSGEDKHWTWLQFSDRIYLLVLSDLHFNLIRINLYIPDISPPPQNETLKRGVPPQKYLPENIQVFDILHIITSPRFDSGLCPWC